MVDFHGYVSLQEGKLLFHGPLAEHDFFYFCFFVEFFFYIQEVNSQNSQVWMGGVL